VGLSLYFVYALSTVLFVQHLDASKVGLVESVIFITQVVRLAGIVAYFGTKPARIEVLLVLLSFETFVVMGLIVMYIISPSALYSELAHTIFSTWIATLFTVLPSYLIFSGVMEMLRHRSLTAVLLSTSLEFGFLTFAASTMLGFGGTFTLGNFFDFLIAAAKTDIASGTIPELSVLSILAPSVALYCSLLVYTTFPTTSSVVPPKVSFVLPLLSAAAALGWSFATVSLAPNTLLSFTVPGIIIVALLWAYIRR
jgi:phage shock protein PspC (stress-responsive transcriptional regulator)